jgi:hypothetical protein
MKKYRTVFFEAEDCEKMNINCAIILNFIRRSCLKKNFGFDCEVLIDKSNKGWVLTSTCFLQKVYPFLTKRQINYSIKNLIKLGEITSMPGHFKKTYYSISCSKIGLKDNKNTNAYGDKIAIIDTKVGSDFVTNSSDFVTNLYRVRDNFVTDTIYTKYNKNKTRDLTTKIEEVSSDKKSVLFSQSLRRELVDVFFADDKSICLLEKNYTESIVVEKINYIKSLGSYASNKISNLLAYLFSSLKFNFTEKYVGLVKNCTGGKLMESKMAEFKRFSDENDIKAKISKYVRSKVRDAYFSMPKEIIEETNRSFLAEKINGNEVIASVYRKSKDLFSGAVGYLFVHYVTSIPEVKQKLSEDLVCYIENKIKWTTLYAGIDFKADLESFEVVSGLGGAYA